MQCKTMAYKIALKWGRFIWMKWIYRRAKKKKHFDAHNDNMTVSHHMISKPNWEKEKRERKKKSVEEGEHLHKINNVYKYMLIFGKVFSNFGDVAQIESKKFFFLDSIFLVLFRLINISSPQYSEFGCSVFLHLFIKISSVIIFSCEKFKSSIIPWKIFFSVENKKVRF